MVFHSVSVVRKQKNSMFCTCNNIQLRHVDTAVSQDYLQINSVLTTDAVMRPKKTFVLKPGKLLDVLELPYGLAKSSHHWFVIMCYYLKTIQIVNFRSNSLNCNVKNTSNQRIGLIFIHSDD